MVEGSLMEDKPTTVYYDEENDIIYVKLLSQINIDNVDAHISSLNSVSRSSKRKCQLIDASDVRNLILDKETRQIMRENGLRLGIRRIAYVGLSPVSRMMFRALHAGNQDTGPEYGFFYNESEALVWLGKEDPVTTEVAYE